MAHTSMYTKPQYGASPLYEHGTRIAHMNTTIHVHIAYMYIYIYIYMYVIVIPCPRGLYGIYCLSPRAEPEGEGNKSHTARVGVV